MVEKFLQLFSSFSSQKPQERDISKYKCYRCMRAPNRLEETMPYTGCTTIFLKRKIKNMHSNFLTLTRVPFQWRQPLWALHASLWPTTWTFSGLWSQSSGTKAISPVLRALRKTAKLVPPCLSFRTFQLYFFGRGCHQLGDSKFWAPQPLNRHLNAL